MNPHTAPAQPAGVLQEAIDAAIRDIQAIDDVFCEGKMFEDKESALLAVSKFHCKYAGAKRLRASKTRIERECGCGATFRLTSEGAGFKVSFREFD